MVRSNIVGAPFSLRICRLIVCEPLVKGSVRNSMWFESVIVPVLDEPTEFLAVVLL